MLWLTNGNARLQTLHNSCRYPTVSSERGAGLALCWSSQQEGESHMRCAPGIQRLH